MNKISLSVILLWVAIGGCLVTLYPLNPITEGEYQSNIDPNIDPITFKPSNDYGNMQETQRSADSDYLQRNHVSDDSVHDESINGDSGNIHSDGNTHSEGDTHSDDIGLVNFDPPIINFEPPIIFSGNKYLVNSFFLNLTEFTAEIINPRDQINVFGFYEIKLNPAANHKDVLQSGYFPNSTGTFTINYNLTEFVPEDDKKYYILVYTNYPESNSVDKANYTYNP